MEEKKEVQVKILNDKANRKATKEEVMTLLKQVSPGTPLRNAIEGIIQSKKGALIVIEKPDLQNIIDGGFRINSRFTSPRVVELAKMDGAIILSKDMKRITHANVTLYPNSKIPTSETGTRHKTAERTSRMLETPVIAVSERKGKTTLYYKDWKYTLREIHETITKATETLHLLEKQRELFDEYLGQLNIHEIYNDLSLEQACKVIQKGISMDKIAKSQEKTLIELGNEGLALKLRIKELLKGVDKQTNLVIKDYTKLNLKKSKNLLTSLTYEEVIDTENIVMSLAQKEINKINDIKGWRILSKTSLEDQELGQIMQQLNTLSNILNSKEEILSPILGEERAKNISKEIQKIKSI